MPTVTLTQADSGKAISVKQGDTFQINLDENPTTGYRWAMDSQDTQVITLISDTYTTTSSGTMLGAGGTRMLTFQAATTGTIQLKLKLWRAWEGDSSIGQRFETSITVQ
ncbi:MAG: protease inhibitor I42 family protein [Oscillochloris sp.]|nr:protease inhibitor I42 family protein [Oscillochloris sp.]